MNKRGRQPACNHEWLFLGGHKSICRKCRMMKVEFADRGKSVEAYYKPTKVVER